MTTDTHCITNAVDPLKDASDDDLIKSLEFRLFWHLEREKANLTARIDGVLDTCADPKDR
jgi:hypothetical protein